MEHNVEIFVVLDRTLGERYEGLRAGLGRTLIRGGFDDFRLSPYGWPESLRTSCLDSQASSGMQKSERAPMPTSSGVPSSAVAFLQVPLPAYLTRTSEWPYDLYHIFAFLPRFCSSEETSQAEVPIALAPLSQLTRRHAYLRFKFHGAVVLS